MFRKAVFASLIALGAAGGAAQAADQGPYLVNRNGNQEVVYGPQHDNVVGGAYATITGGGDDEVITYTAPARGNAASVLQAGRPGGTRG